MNGRRPVPSTPDLGHLDIVDGLPDLHEVTVAVCSHEEVLAYPVE